MTSTTEGRTAYVHADLREPEAILSAPQLRATLDLDRPVALLAIAVLHFIADDDEATSTVWSCWSRAWCRRTNGGRTTWRGVW